MQMVPTLGPKVYKKGPTLGPFWRCRVRLGGKFWALGLG